jgi:hypothetical protein
VKRTNLGPLLARLYPIMIPAKAGIHPRPNPCVDYNFSRAIPTRRPVPMIFAAPQLAQSACGLIAIDAGRSLPMINGNSTCD